MVATILTAARRHNPVTSGIARPLNPLIEGLWVDRPPATIARVTGIDTLAERLAQVDADTLFDELAARLERIVPFDASLFFGTDPATLLATFPARIDGVANNQCHAYWQREFLVEDANLFRDLARAPIPANTLWAATDNLPARSARYREFLRPERFGDELRVAFRVAGSAWGVASLMRGAGRPPFTREEAALVTALSEPVGRALRRVALDRPPAPRPAPTAPGLMLFDRDGELLSANNEARIWLGELDEPPIGPRPFGSALPTEVVGVIAGARAVADGCSSTPARLRLRSPDGRWLLLHATALRDMEGERGSVAVVIEPARGEEIAPIIVEAYGLSRREQEVTSLIARGAGTADIAATLFLSPHTVRDHVKAVFEKAGVSTRGELTAKLFAEHYAPPLKATARHVDGE